MKQLARLILFSLIACSTIALAQQEPTPTPSAEEVKKQQAEWSKNAYRLLDQILDEAQSLRLPENRIRIQINGADLLWDRDQARARSLFSLAGDGVAEMMRTNENTQRPGPNQNRRQPSQLRQELVLAAARHDAPLAYQLLAITKPAVTAQPNDARMPRPVPINSEDNLEQSLLAAIASRDPKLAAQNAEQSLEKGQFPSSLTDVINNLRSQDQQAAAKLADKTVKRLQSANLLTSVDAEALALRMLNAGPRLEASTASDTAPKSRQQARGPVLDQSLYIDLLGSVIDAALKATPALNNQRGPNTPRGRGQVNVGRANPQNQSSDGQVEQGNARRLLLGLQRLLPRIDQHLPMKSLQVRQKLSEIGMGDARAAVSFGETLNSLRGDATADSIMQAAATAPPQIQARLYQQAAFKALDEGNPERARQIASDHLDSRFRDSVIQRIDLRELATKAEGARMEEVRQTLGRLQSDNDRIEQLVQLSGQVLVKNPKLARQLLEEASQITNKRASNYDQFEQQLQVANAFSEVDPARSFEVLDPGISQLNELLSAAAVLNGFETNVFRDGELPLQGGSALTTMVGRYGQAIAALARKDLESAETLAGRFQFPESRIMARLSIVQGLLGLTTQPQQNNNFLRAFSEDFGNTVVRPE